MGAIVTLDLPDDSPAHDLPWIITFGPADDDGEGELWEPVVCGPYEREHALALAQAVVADKDLMAVVEPLQPRLSAADILAEIDNAKAAAAAWGDEEEDEGDEHDEASCADHDHGPGEDVAAPTEAELKAGFARIAARLSGS